MSAIATATERQENKPPTFRCTTKTVLTQNTFLVAVGDKEVVLPQKHIFGRN